MSQSDQKSRTSREDATTVVSHLRGAGHVAYFAGGCVRDMLLGLEPKDFDVATDAPPQRVRELFPRTQAVGAAFGVILVRQGRSVIEVATFRSEGRYLDGRRPSHVTFTTSEQDAQRRDFTINGLFMDPLDHDRIIDFVGGRQDLAEKRLRAIGNPAERFAEDHLRLLRAVRFAARFGLEIETQTAGSILAEAPRLKLISPERIGEELRLMLTPPTRSLAWELLWRFRLIDVIFRFLHPPNGLTLVPRRSMFLSLNPGGGIPFGLALATGCLCVRWQAMAGAADLRGLLSREPVHEMVQAMRQALKISNDESEQMQQVLEGIAPLLADERPGVAAMKRFLAGAHQALSRHLLDALDQVGLHCDRIGWLRQRLGELEQTPVAPAPLITGDDLMAAGLQPGPLFKRILDTVYDAQLEDRVREKAEAMRLAVEQAGHNDGA